MRIDPNSYFAFPIIASGSPLWGICKHCKDAFVGIGGRVVDCSHCLGTRTSIFGPHALPKWVSDVIDRRNLPLSNEWVNISWGVDSTLGRFSFCMWIHINVGGASDLYPESDLLNGIYSDFMRGHHDIYDIHGNLIGKWNGGRYTVFDNGNAVYETSAYEDNAMEWHARD